MNLCPRFESGDRIPRVISKEAWDAARAIDSCIQGLFDDAGFPREIPPGGSKIPGILAEIVQLAINRAIGKVDA